jgi:hypothetical protein
MTRDPFLKFATFTGKKFVGGLVTNDQLSVSLGYKIYYSGAPGAVLEQTGLPQLPEPHVTLSRGWNWIGHAPLRAYPIDKIASVVGSPQFSTDDQIKTRAGSDLRIATYTGGSPAIWAGNMDELVPGIGYEVKVAKALSFCYGTSCNVVVEM